MEAWWPVIAFLVGIGALLLLVARIQNNAYRSYLDKHLAETAKVTEAQRMTLEAVSRQSAALERIATALERK